MFRFIDMPCLMKNVAGCWKMTANISRVVQMGRSWITTFAILTRWLLLFEFSSSVCSVSGSCFRQSGLSSSLKRHYTSVNNHLYLLIIFPKSSDIANPLFLTNGLVC